MRNLIKILAIASLSLVYKAKAQQVVRQDTIAGTEVTMTMDSRIGSMLEKMENNCARPTTKSPGVRNHVDDDGDAPEPTYRPATSPSRISVPSRALTNAEICRQNPKILGYKIQLVVVKSNEEANKVKAYFRNRFPSIKAETDASLRPNYKILAGSYLNRQSAASDLRQIRQYFKSAIPVQYRVFCVEAK